MKTYYPSYYKSFRCIAGECPDSCCKSWEIIIDKETLGKYERLSGEFADKIRSSLTTDSDGDTCFVLNNGRCPFLNSDGLCDIHINLSEDFTSDICKKHPRFTEEYDSFTEITLSLSCPEANNIIFSDEISSETYPVPEYNGDDEVLELLINSRRSLLEEKCSFSELVKKLLETSADDSLDIDMVYIADFPEFDVSFIRNYISCLKNNEILTDEWKHILHSTVNNEISNEKIIIAVSDNESDLIKLCRYLIYRYYLKAVNDLDIYSRALFIIASCFTCLYLSSVCDISFRECARLYSKETEHNTENIDNILDYFSNF